MLPAILDEDERLPERAVFVAGECRAQGRSAGGREDDREGGEGTIGEDGLISAFLLRELRVEQRPRHREGGGPGEGVAAGRTRQPGGGGGRAARAEDESGEGEAVSAQHGSPVSILRPKRRRGGDGHPRSLRPRRRKPRHTRRCKRPPSHAQSSPRLPDFVCALRFLSASRLSTLPRVGRVARLGRGLSSARATRALTFSYASARFIRWSRVRWLVTRSSPSASSDPAHIFRRRPRAPSSSPWTNARSTRSSTLLDTLFTFCPPGPLARTARMESASAGTTTPGRTKMASGTEVQSNASAAPRTSHHVTRPSHDRRAKGLRLA